MYLVGGRVGFFNGNMKYISEDMKILKPTIIPAVPRLLNRIYDNEMAVIRPSFFKRMLFNLAMNAKHSQLKRYCSIYIFNWSTNRIHVYFTLAIVCFKFSEGYIIKKIFLLLIGHNFTSSIIWICYLVWRE